MSAVNHRRPGRAWLAALALLAAGTARAEPMQAYIALGDSIAFGQTTATPQQSFGDQGYVGQFANFLATQNNGVRPNVINLALPGETSASYFAGGNSSAGANLNYGGDSTLAQRNFLAGVVAAERATGNVVSTVSFALGLGDVLPLLYPPSGTPNLTPGQIQTAVQQVLNTLQANYVTALTQVRGVLPNAQLYLPNYYNPFTALGPNDQKNQIMSLFVTGQNQILQSLAPQFNGKIVDVMSAFANSPGNVTTSGPGFPFPNANGYSLIANELATVASVPEPGTLTLLAFGAAGVLGCRLRRRAA